MGTFVLPMGSATVAIPAVNRWSDLHAVVVRPARLNIVGNVEDVDELEGEKRLRIKTCRQCPDLLRNLWSA